MKGKTGPVSEHLRPILDTYMDAAVALVGCTATGLQRYSCEFDVLVVGDRRPPTSLKIGDIYADVYFVPEKEILKPAGPERALSLALCKPVRDTSLVLSTASSAFTATLSSTAGAASRVRLTSALKTVTRAEAALAKGDLVDADFWLLAGSYEFAYALLFSREAVPSPSHVMSQLREASKGAANGFEGISIAAGLDAASRAGCGARLEGVTVLHDILREGQKDPAQPGWPKVKTEMMTAKAQELMTRVELAECYSFLGQELIDGMLALRKSRLKGAISDLTTGDDRLLGERLVRQLGLARDGESIKKGLELLKRQVAQLAKG
ncbi:MAG: hypothetical protein JRN21_04170 [Nitrososphaerota archaeon]|nr:hypothetical protein [Nitrososphaerota archaeon]